MNRREKAKYTTDDAEVRLNFPYKDLVSPIEYVILWGSRIANVNNYRVVLRYEEEASVSESIEFVEVMNFAYIVIPNVSVSI